MRGSSSPSPLPTGSPRRLTIALSQELGFPVWSPDRRSHRLFVAMSEEAADLMMLDVDDRRDIDPPRRLQRVGGLGSTTVNVFWWVWRRGCTFPRCRVRHPRTESTPAAPPMPTAAAHGHTDLIAYESSRDGNPEIYITYLASGRTARLTENTVLDEWPSPSPDGSKIAWASGTEEDKNLWVMRSDGSEKRQVTSGLLFGDAFPEWSPDGTKILLTVNENDTFVLKLIDPTTGTVQDLGEGAAPSWR